MNELVSEYLYRTVHGDAPSRVVSDLLRPFGGALAFVEADPAVACELARNLVQTRELESELYDAIESRAACDSELLISIRWLKRVKIASAGIKNRRLRVGDVFALPVLSTGFFACQYIGDGLMGNSVVVFKSWSESEMSFEYDLSDVLVGQVQTALRWAVRDNYVCILGNEPIRASLSRDYIGTSGPRGHEEFYLQSDRGTRDLGSTLPVKYRGLPWAGMYALYKVEEMIRMALRGEEIPVPFYVDH